jgi:arylsulfatase A-like enzyme
MTRRILLLASLCLCVIVPGRWLGARPQPQPQPNIILLLLDDQDAYTPFWDAMPATDQMVRQRGTQFLTAIAPTPICTPGRATLLSGRLAHNTGCFTLVGPHGGANFSDQVDRTFAVELSKLGYTTAMFGKSWGSTQINPGWSEWTVLGGQHLYEGYGYEVTDQHPNHAPDVYVSATYSTDFLSQRMTRFLLEQQNSSHPFFVWLAPTAPHLPLPPAQRHLLFAKAQWNGRLPIRPNYNEHNIKDKSSWLKSTGEARSAAVPYANHEYYKRMGSLLAVDEMMAHIRDILIAQGKWDNTIIVVTSDNGYNLGSHRLIHKFAPYEESIRIPLVMAGPGVPKAEISRMVGLQDLGSTFIELAGGQPPAYYDGKSLVPFLYFGIDNIAGWRTEQLTEYDTGGVHPGYNPGGSERAGYSLDLPTYRSLRTDSHKYIRWLATKEEEVYDLVNDPMELNNLLKTNRAVGMSLRAELSPRMDAILHCGGAGCP